jgi:hypothetical protein
MAKGVGKLSVVVRTKFLKIGLGVQKLMGGDTQTDSMVFA